MQIREIVIDASPLITLFRSGQSEILPQLFENIWIPDAVWLEITQGGHHDLAAQQLPRREWAKRIQVGIIPEVIQRRDLGKGESEVLTFAWYHPTVRAMVDDYAARQCAKAMKIATLGTGGMLVLAKRRGIISSVQPALIAVRRAGLWLSEEVVSLLLSQAGEKP